jgi:hypothetical protein
VVRVGDVALLSPFLVEDRRRWQRGEGAVLASKDGDITDLQTIRELDASKAEQLSLSHRFKGEQPHFWSIYTDRRWSISWSRAPGCLLAAPKIALTDHRQTDIAFLSAQSVQYRPCR